MRPAARADAVVAVVFVVRAGESPRLLVLLKPGVLVLLLLLLLLLGNLSPAAKSRLRPWNSASCDSRTALLAACGPFAGIGPETAASDGCDLPLPKRSW